MLTEVICTPPNKNPIDPGYEADLENFKTAFRTRLAAPAISQRVSRQVSVINRRLDALARLLETDQTCVAVRYDISTQKISIASNEIHATSRPTNNSIENIQTVMSLLANRRSTMPKIIEDLSDIVAKNICAEYRFEVSRTRKSLQTVKKQVVSCLHSLFASGKKIREWEKLAVEESVEKIDKKIVQRTARLVMDFMKLRKSLCAISHAEEEAKPILEALASKQFSVCRQGGATEHAEIRHLHNLEAAGENKFYIGISKLCCARCTLSVEVVEGHTRGQHGGVFNKWGMPRFFGQNPALFRRFLGGDAAQVYETLPERAKQDACAFIQDGNAIGASKNVSGSMLADTSASDEGSGITDLESDLANMTINDVMRVKEVKASDPDGYRAIRETESGIAAVMRFATFSSPKYTALTTPHVLALLRTAEDFTREDLSDLYDEDSVLFKYVVQDENRLIEKEGFEGAVARYRRALECSRASHVRSFSGDDYFANDGSESVSEEDVNALAIADYNSEEGWSYKEYSDDSENRFRYSSGAGSA